MLFRLGTIREKKKKDAQVNIAQYTSNKKGRGYPLVDSYKI